jgi:hypothetical protein
VPSIQLPLDGDQPDDWLLLIVKAATGVTYQHQYGGYLCHQARIEGFLVPVCQPQVLGRLRQVFSDRLGGYAMSGTKDWTEHKIENLISEIEKIVGATGYPAASEEPPAELPPVALDRGRLEELDEAWIPVRTPDGAGYLAWTNSD